VLRRIFGSKTDDVTGEWRKLHNEELIDLYSQNIIWAKNEMGGACTRMERGEVHTGHLEVPGVVWLRIGTGGGNW